MDDTVDAAEMLRNDRVYSYQTNRNPFVDHPEWVTLTFAPAHTSPPVLHVSGKPPNITLSWLATNQSTRLEFSTNISAGWTEAPVKPTLTSSLFVLTWTNQTRPSSFACERGNFHLRRGGRIFDG